MTAGFFFSWYSHVETSVEKKLHHKTAIKLVPSGEPEKSLVSPEFQCRIFAGFLSPPHWREDERGAHRQPINIIYRQSLLNFARFPADLFLQS